MRGILVLSIAAIILNACARLDPAPLMTETALAPLRVASATQPPGPTDTPLPPTATLDAIKTLLPQQAPDKLWQGIPIMPGALKGEGDDIGYSFTVGGTPEQVRDFYVGGLAERGWVYLPYAQGDTGPDLMVFKSGGQTLIISVHTLEDGTLLVLMVK